MNLTLRVKLSIMMFLQYAVWSIWALMLVPHLADLKISEFSIGLVMACAGIGSILGPFLMGTLADRYFATERVIAFCHLIGGVLLILAAYQTTFWPIFVLMLLYCSLYFPTVGLTNSLTFRALGDEHASKFAPIRLWGTIGWLAATSLTGLYLGLKGADAPTFQPLFDLVGEPSKRDVLRIPGLISLVYGLYCFLLPHTPPVAASADGPKKSPLVESLQLLRDRSFAVLILVSGLVGFCLYYYFQCEGRFLPAVGSDSNKVGTQMIIGQVGEVISMALVPLMVAHVGIKRTMTLGALAYVGLFGLNALGQPWALMVGANILHGFCFGFFFVVAQIFVDRAASADIKASAQSLFVFVVFGLFNVIGNIAAGALRDVLLPEWRLIWAIPLGISVLAILLFLALFRDKTETKPAGVLEEVAA